MNNSNNYLTMKILYAQSATLQKTAIINAITEWNLLYSEYYNKEILMNEEILNLHHNNRGHGVTDLKTKDIVVYLFDINDKDEVMNNSDLHNHKLEILTNKSIVFFDHQVKNISITNDLKILIHQKINELDNKLSEFDIFSLFDNLEKESLLLLTFTMDTKNMYYYPEWVTRKSINLIQNWAIENNLTFDTSLYKSTIINLTKLNLLEIIEFTEYGNPKLYRVPYRIIDKLTIYQNIKSK